MNTRKQSTRHLNMMFRIAAVIVLVIATLPAVPLSQVSASAASFEIRTKPNAVATSSPLVTQIVAGGTHTCALTAEGGVVCWGANDFGQLGDGTTNESNVPVAVQGLSSGVMSLTLVWGATCALTTFGRVYCWGGIASAQGHSSVPVEIIRLGQPGGSVGRRRRRCLRADFFRQSPVLGL